MKSWFVLLFSLVSLLGALAEQCGKQAGGALCPGGLCCSQYGYCGTTDDYCKIENGCQSQCDDGGSPPTPVPPTPTPTPVPPTPSPSGGDDVSSLISQTLFDEILKHRNDSACFGAFYTYDAFIAASRFFNGFGTTGDTNTRKREIVAFLAQTSHETTGGWATAPDGPYAWGYCFVREQAPIGDYCQVSAQWPCVSGKRYYGRGPIQISWNYNYGQAGEALGLELLHNPDLVETDPLISFKTAIWFWMTPQYAKPSCHAVITGQWTPTDADTTAGRVPGYGVITNIINGGLECGQGYNEKVASRIGFYKKYCDKMGLDYGDNLDCYTQRPFGQTALLLPE